jgi:hypothetical protein
VQVELAEVEAGVPGALIPRMPFGSPGQWQSPPASWTAWTTVDVRVEDPVSSGL